MKATLSDVCNIIAGYAFKGKDFNGDGYPVIKITDIQPPYASTISCSHVNLSSYDTSKLTKYLVSRNDFVIAMTGATIGKIGRITSGQAYINQRVAKFEINDSTTKAFVYQLLLSDSFTTHINSNIDSQSAQPNISAGSIGRFEFDLPTKDQQRHIVDILGTLDETIENNEYLIQKIEEKVLLEYDRINSFEPLSEIVMSDCFDITIGKTPPRKESHWFTKNSTDIKWLSISDLGKSSVFCFDTSERITPEGISKYNVKVVPKNTVVLSFKLTVGKVAITGCDMATNEAIAHFNSSNHCLLEYLYCYLKRYNFDTLGNTSSIATAVNSKTIKAMHFFIPDDTMLENFHHKTLPLFENIRQLLIENQKLNELKQLYLKKFFG